VTVNSSNKNLIYPSGTTANRPTAVNNGFIYFNTTIGALQIYQSGSWYVLTNINAPGIPTSVTATNQGSGRAYNNGQASVAFTPATETFGFPATYTLTPTPTTSPATFTGTSSPIIVTGLASSTQYTYTVSATNNTGTSSASSASSGVTATTVPQAPTIGAVSAGNAQADVSFTAGATGGAAITGYTITSSPGSITATGSTSPISVTGLTNGTAYTFTATATNSNGTSAASSASSSATPSAWAPEGAYDSLGTVTLSTATPSVTFSGIPSGYKHLQIRGTLLTSGATNPSFNFNGDTGSNYAWHHLWGTGVSAASNYGSGQTFMYFNYNPSTSYPSSFVIDILDYASTTKYKTSRTLAGSDTNGGTSEIAIWSGLWQNTNAITSITLNGAGVNFTQYSSFALYGVK
jgi:hypothetical protein